LFRIFFQLQELSIPAAATMNSTEQDTAPSLYSYGFFSDLYKELEGKDTIFLLLV
jgi:hypothetical protein